MELLKKLSIDGKKAELEAEDLRLRYMLPGAALFQIRSQAEPATLLGQPVRFSLGWDSQKTLLMYFSGYVDNAVKAGDGLLRLHCQEESARLENIIPLALRHPTLEEVLKAYAEKTKLQFELPKKAYAASRVSAFYMAGPGLHGLQSLGSVFSIPDYFWQTHGDGKIFVGAYADSFWNGRKPEISDKYFSGASVDGTRKISAIPALRPGAELNGQRVREVRLAGNFMEVTCRS